MKRLLIICVAAAFVTALGNTVQAATWHVPGDFATIQEAIDSPDVGDGDTIIVGPGNHDGATVTKAVEIKGEDGAVINSGPDFAIYWYTGEPYTTGFLFPWSDPGVGNGATISHLSFETLDLPIYSRNTHDVTVDHCTFTSPNQAITNWNGKGWNISHNVINGLRTMNGGGIGIFVGTRDATASTANNNLIAHNTITGMVVVPDYEIDQYTVPGTGYSVPGITLMSDRRYGKPAGTISGNSILKNKVSITSNNPDFHPAVGIGLSDLGLLPEPFAADLLGNKVGFNDVRGMLEEGTPINLYPEEEADAIAENNIISRNLGDDANNRGGGAHPQAIFD